ncbi:MAG TPA: carboxypeptidase-like regulatory domain-containing protein, partial [Terriglobia bacterium]|nr:carboxypeptidase-like regulatory domain-containing protein [Terriglobia bacterium]
IRMDGEDVLERGVHLQGQPPREIEVVLGVNGGTFQGTIVDARRQPIPNSVVVIVPSAILRARRDLYKSATSDANGRFRLVGLAPGDYQLFAWKYLEEGRWYDPQFLASVETRGKALRIDEGSLETIELPVLPEEP